MMNPFDYSKGYIDALNTIKTKIDEMINAHEYELGCIADNITRESSHEII